MATSCGLVGLPMVGKTTFFNLLTGAGASTSSFMTGKVAIRRGTATVPDARIDFLAGLYQPRKVVYAQLEVTDVPGLVRGSSRGAGTGNDFLEAVRRVDALVYVLRAFQNPQVMPVEGSIDPWRELTTVNLELILADLSLAETRRERLAEARKKTPLQVAEEAALAEVTDILEDERSLSTAELSPGARAALVNLDFLTQRPVILVVNLDEQQLAARDYDQADKIRAYAATQNIPLLEICARTEMEINELEPADREIFLAELGIDVPGIERLARAMYQALGLIAFFTVGEDEVKAWTIKKGTTAHKAAGKVHSDIERGFIRAEVVAYDDLAAAGSMARAREKGLVRLEGKDYVVADGDIIHFRFNV